MNTQKKVQLLKYKLSRSLGSSLFGAYDSAFGGQGIDFFEHKEYVDGDPIHSIDWRASAKTEKMQTKVFEETRDLEVIIGLDISSSFCLQFGEKSKKELLEEVLSSIGFSSWNHGDTVGIFAYGDGNIRQIKASKSLVPVYQAVECIQTIDKSAKNIEQKTNICMQKILEQKIKGKLIFFLTDDLQIEENSVFKQLAVNNTLVFFHLFDSFEEDLELGNADISLQSQSQNIHISLRDESKKAQYIDLRTKKYTRFQQICKKYQIKTLKLTTKSDVYRELFLFFKQSL